MSCLRCSSGSQVRNGPTAPRLMPLPCASATQNFFHFARYFGVSIMKWTKVQPQLYDE